MDTNIAYIKLFQYKDAYMNQATPQQHLKLSS